MQAHRYYVSGLLACYNNNIRYRNQEKLKLLMGQHSQMIDSYNQTYCNQQIPFPKHFIYGNNSNNNNINNDGNNIINNDNDNINIIENTNNNNENTVNSKSMVKQVLEECRLRGIKPFWPRKIDIRNALKELKKCDDLFVQEMTAQVKNSNDGGDGSNLEMLQTQETEETQKKQQQQQQQLELPIGFSNIGSHPLFVQFSDVGNNKEKKGNKNLKWVDQMVCYILCFVLFVCVCGFVRVGVVCGCGVMCCLPSDNKGV